MNLSPEQELQIRQVIGNCGHMAAKITAQEQFQIFQKGPNDYVTNVDRELDRYLASAFMTLFPEDGVISEENPLSRQAFFNSYDRLWVIDPLDGTEDFIQGKPDYSVMVGLLQCGRPVAGWVYAPVSGQMYYGNRLDGLFTYRGEAVPEVLRPTEPSPPSAEFCPVMIGTRDQKNYGEALTQKIPGIQFSSLGSFGLKVMEVILGRAGLYLYLNGRVKVWDTAGPIALAETAGLICCDLTGQPISFEADFIESDTLTHKQAFLIGWPQYIEALQPKIAEAAAAVFSGSGQ